MNQLGHGNLIRVSLNNLVLRIVVAVETGAMPVAGLDSSKVESGRFGTARFQVALNKPCGIRLQTLHADGPLVNIFDVDQGRLQHR